MSKLIKPPVVICDHHEGCPDKDCPHRTPHTYKTTREDEPCGGDCDLAPYGTECIVVENYTQKMDKPSK